MMNDAMRATEAMMVAAVKAVDERRVTRTREDCSFTHIFVDSVYEGRQAQIGVITIYGSGRWTAHGSGDSGATILCVTPELEALRFRRAA